MCCFSPREPQLLLNQKYKKAKKGLIWSHFCQSISDLSEVICNYYCGGAYSLGSDKLSIINVSLNLFFATNHSCKRFDHTHHYGLKRCLRGDYNKKSN